MTPLATHIRTLQSLQPVEVAGSVSLMRGLTLHVDDLALPIGSLVRIEPERVPAAGIGSARGEVVGFDGRRSIVMLLTPAAGIAPGATVPPPAGKRQPCTSS